MKNFGFSWVDFLVLALLLVGLVRGRQRGMTQEFFDLLKWPFIIVVAGKLYEPGGRLLAQFALFNLLPSYLFAYAVVALVVFSSFAFIRRQVGDKLTGSDVFGRGEYYLGMMAGTIRYGCVILVGMACLNARHYSPAEVQASAKYQQDNFGSSFFFSLPDMQREVFTASLSGRAAQEHLRAVFIRPTAPGEKVQAAAAPRR